MRLLVMLHHRGAKQGKTASAPSSPLCREFRGRGRSCNAASPRIPKTTTNLVGPSLRAPVDAQLARGVDTRRLVLAHSEVCVVLFSVGNREKPVLSPFRA